MSAGDPGLSSFSAAEERAVVLLIGRARVRPRRAVREMVVLIGNMMMDGQSVYQKGAPGGLRLIYSSYTRTRAAESTMSLVSLDVSNPVEREPELGYIK